eukprot:363084-Chlamydomonas_euryale.AAC.3
MPTPAPAPCAHMPAISRRRIGPTPCRPPARAVVDYAWDWHLHTSFLSERSICASTPSIVLLRNTQSSRPPRHALVTSALAMTPMAAPAALPPLLKAACSIASPPHAAGGQHLLTMAATSLPAARMARRAAASRSGARRKIGWWRDADKSMIQSGGGKRKGRQGGGLAGHSATPCGAPARRGTRAARAHGRAPGCAWSAHGLHKGGQPDWQPCSSSMCWLRHGELVCGPAAS